MTDTSELFYYYIGSVIELECLAFFYCSIMNTRYPKWLFYVLYPIISICPSIPDLSVWRDSAFIRPLISLMISFGMVCVFSRDKLWKKIVFTIIPYFINVVASFFVIMFYGLMVSDSTIVLGHPTLFMEIFIIVSMLAGELIVISFINRYESRLSDKLTRYFTLLGWAQFIIYHCALCAYFIDISFNVYITVIGAYIFLSALFMFFIFKTMFKITAEQKKQQHIEDQYTHLCDQYNFLQENYMTYRKLRHDLKDHILAVVGLAKSNETDKLDKYSKALIDNWNSLSNKTFCDSAAIDIIISEKYNIAVNSGIKINVDLQGLKTCGIDDIYLCTIFSNILKNAIEAAQGCADNAYIKLTSYIKMGNVVIKCKNSISDNSPEPDRKERGFGMKILNEIADILGGNFVAVKTENEFSAIFNAPVCSEVKV